MVTSPGVAARRAGGPDGPPSAGSADPLSASMWKGNVTRSVPGSACLAFRRIDRATLFGRPPAGQSPRCVGRRGGARNRLTGNPPRPGASGRTRAVRRSLPGAAPIPSTAARCVSVRVRQCHSATPPGLDRRHARSRPSGNASVDLLLRAAPLQRHADLPAPAQQRIHRTPVTTLKYTHLADSMVREAAETVAAALGD